MILRILPVLVFLLSFLMPAEDLRDVLINRIDAGKKAVGIVAGTIDAKGRHIVAYGSVSTRDQQTPDGDTVFEIGSITKVFTSLLLADMVERGEVKLDDPVAKFLPAGVKVPSQGPRQITLLDLSMQVSGLPRLPTNMKPADPENPYADYDAKKLYEFLSGYTLTRDIGSKYEYSNLAVGLLGHALALRAGMSYEDLLRKRIFEPLGMTSTSITLSPAQRKRLAIGHNPELEPVKNWDLDALAGAGAIRSTANDMLTFLTANLELTGTPLKAAMRRMRSVEKDTGVPDLHIAMAWHIWKKYGGAIYWHNGGTAGYRSFAGFDLEKKTGVVVLCNTFYDIDDIGLHTLNAGFPLPMLEAPKPEITVAPEILERYVGEYQLTPKFSITVTREDNRLYVQATGQSRFPVFAQKPNEFALKVVDAQITFEVDPSGKTTGLVLHQGGRDQKAPKVK